MASGCSGGSITSSIFTGEPLKSPDENRGLGGGGVIAVGGGVGV